jgi:hypothetical protein
MRDPWYCMPYKVVGVDLRNDERELMRRGEEEEM